MLNLSNSLSLLRGPLALFFLFESTTIRLAAIILAMITDSIDGYLARRSHSASRFGAILDPTMDKFFVIFALVVFRSEGRLATWEVCAMISRDFSLCLFGIYLTVSGYWQSYEFRAIRWGKITTALQFLILIGLTYQIVFHWYLYSLFIVFSALAFAELLQFKKSTTAV